MSLRVRVCLALIGITLCARVAFAEGQKPRVKGQALVAPVIVDRLREDTAWIFPNADQARFLIESSTLLEITQKYLPAESQTKLREMVSPEGTLTLKNLEDLGLEARFDERALDLHLLIPPTIRYRSDVNLRRGPIENAVTVGPAPYSGYLNVRASQGFRLTDQALGGNQRLPMTGNLELINNYKGWVLETGADFAERTARQFRRSDTRLVTDDEARVMRYSAGDLQITTTGFQSVQSAGGFSATRNFAIQPYRTTRPLNRTEVFLKRPSTVEVFVNDVFVSRLQLPAGPFNLQDYPLTVGQNDVQLRVTDDLGETETVDLAVLFDNQLLSTGLHQFGYSLGFVSTPTVTDRTYDSGNLLASFFHRVGVSDVLTLGANVQRDRWRSLLGLEAYWATQIGTLLGDLAASKDPGAAKGEGFRLRYRSLERWGKREAQTLVTLNSEFRSKDFGAPGSATSINLYSWRLESFLTQKLPWELRAGAGYQYQFSRVETPDRRVMQLDLSKVWMPSLQTSVNYSVTRDMLTEHRVFASLMWTDPVNRHNVQSTYDSVNAASRVDWFRQPEKPYDDVRFAAGVQHDRDQNEVDAQVEFVGRQAELKLDHQSAVPHRSLATHQTALSLGTSLVWTNQSFGVSRPVSESFVIVHDQSSSGVKIPVNHNGSYPEAMVNSFGPGVIPSLLSYYEQPVNLGTSTLPDGYTLNREFQVARPTYRSGVDIRLQIKAAAVASGKLLLPEKAPLALASGEVVRVVDETGEGRVHEAFVASFFTNARGQYYVEGLEAGSYELRFYDATFKPVRIKIQRGQAGMVRFEPIVVSRQE